MKNSSKSAGNSAVYYGMYILSMLIFGTNGFFVAHISVESSQIVLVRTLIGGLMLTVLVLLRGGFDRNTVRNFELGANVLQAVKSRAEGRFAVLAADTQNHTVSLLDSVNELEAIGAIMSAITSAVLGMLANSGHRVSPFQPIQDNCFGDGRPCTNNRVLSRDAVSGRFVKAAEAQNGVSVGSEGFHIGNLSRWV